MRLKTFGGLWIEWPDATPTPASGGPRPRPLALLAILAANAPKGVSRERVLGILWPDSDPDRARHALSQTLYSLRRDLGGEAVLATPDLRLDPRTLTSDLEEFRAAIASKNWERAAGLYTGPFLEGFYLGEAPEFERWAEEERSALATSGIRAIESFARECSDAGRTEEMVEQWRRLTRLDPFNSRFAASYMEALASSGDRAAALAHGKAHAELVKRELDAEPDRAIRHLMARLREPDRPSVPVVRVADDAKPLVVAVATPSPAPVEIEVPPARAVSEDPPSPPVTVPSSPKRRIAGAIGVAAALVLLALGWRTVTALRADERPVLAVGRIRDLVAPDSAALGGVLSEMLSTSLARVADLQVIANSRILELTARDATTSSVASNEAARRAGATQVIEGELSPIGKEGLRLEVRRVDMRSGLVRGAYRIEGTDRIAMFDSVTALIASDLRLGTPSGSLADVSTRSPLAYRLYEEGLRAFFQYDAPAAARLFRAAIREDSSFAMATYYAWRTAMLMGDSSQNTIAERASQLATRASTRDRLLIRTHVGVTRSDPNALAAAESLVTAYPRDPEVLVRSAEVVHVRDLPRATSMLERAIALDSAAGAGAAAVCRLCDAFALLWTLFDWADSSQATERTIRRWSRLRPADAPPWAALAEHLIATGRRPDAEAARRRYLELGGEAGNPALHALNWSLRTDDLATADSLCRDRLPVVEESAFGTWRWYCTIALRMEGRYRDALALNADGRVPRSTVVRRGVPPDEIIAAILDFEMGRPQIAATTFLGRAHASARTDVGPGRHAPGFRARTHGWFLTLAATAMVEAGDTARARTLVDSIETTGQQSLFPRDPKLHHFVRGLLYTRGQRHVAAVRELQAAMTSPTHGYTRINYELANSLSALHRHQDAIRVLSPTLRGGIEGSALYLTRTATHERLAQLFDANGQRDSAAAHYRAVERAWRSADPQYAARYDAARRWLSQRGLLHTPRR